MEVTLLVVTLLSIALAIAMGILTWRLLQEERLRSDARVAALEQGLAETMQHAYVTQAAASSAVPRTTGTASVGSASSSPASSNPLSSAAITPAPATATLSASTSSEDEEPIDLLTRDDTDWLAHFPASTMEAAAAARNGDLPFKADPFAANDISSAARPLGRRPLAASVENVESDETVTGDADDTRHAAHRPLAVDDVLADTVVNANGGLFGQIDADDSRVGWPRHVLAVAAVAAVMIGAVIAFWTIGRLMEPAADRPGTVATRAGAGAAVNGANGANGAVTTALELMSLNQEMQDGKLTISGLVRNPRGGVPQERLTAVVFFFDGQGGFLSSTRAPLDYRALAPGDESPFQLSAPAPAGVARYRVSFRRDEGAIVPHIDRRQQVQQSLHGQADQHSNASQPGQQQEASRS
jgi:hypothetical protein